MRRGAVPEGVLFELDARDGAELEDADAELEDAELEGEPRWDSYQETRSLRAYWADVERRTTKGGKRDGKAT